MYFVLAHKENNEICKRFLMPKLGEQSEDWVEIEIDEKAGEFFAKRVKGKFEENEEWKKYKDSTFAASLFSKFLRQEH